MKRDERVVRSEWRAAFADCLGYFRFLALLFPFSTAVIPDSSPVIPAKAGIQMVEAMFATRNQVRIPTSGSPLPLWAYRGRLTLNSVGLSLRRRSDLRPVIPAKAGIQTVSAKPATRNQVQIAVIGSPLPLWAYRGMLTLNSVGLSLRRRSDLRPVIPAKAGIQTAEAMFAHPKSSTNTNQRIPSPFMGEG